MKIIDRIKAAFTTDKPSRYEAASTATLIGRNYVPPPFNYHQAVIECRSWIYAAARLNAIAVASAPLRLYVRRREGAKRLWNTRRTGRRTKAYLSGDLGQHPSRYAMTKAAEFGDDYEIVTDAHPLLELLSKVNPYQNGFDATVLRVLYAELTGNAYLHPVIDPALNVPVELWTMPPQWVKIVPGNPLRDEPWIKAYEYGRNDAQRQDFAPDEVIHFKYPNPRDLYYGLGKVEAAWGAVTSNQALHEMDYHFFANKSRPDYLLVTKGNASDEELERFTAQVETKLRGTNKTGRFLAITGDVDLKPLQFPPKDLQGREEIVEEIAAVFGVPVSMLRANDPNLASATVGFATWKETTILPMLRMDEEVLNQNLVPLFGIEGDAFLAYDNPVRADDSSETNKRISYVQGGILTANEAREQEGLDKSIDRNADRLLINGQPLGGQALPMVGAVPVAPAAPVVETPDVADVAPVPGEAIADTALNGAQVTSLVDLATAIGVGQLPKDTAIAIAGAAFPAIAPDQIRAMFDPIEPSSQPAAVPATTSEVAPEVEPKAVQRKDACGCGCGCGTSKTVKQSDFLSKHKDASNDGGFSAWLKTKNAEREAAKIAKREKEAAARISQAFDRQVKELLAALAAAERPSVELIQQAERIMRSRLAQRAVVEALTPYIREAIETGITIGVETVEKIAPQVDFEAERADLAKYAETESVRLSRRTAQGVIETQTEKVRTVLGDGLEKGENIDQLATRVQEWADGQKDQDGSWSRATTIARTESMRAARSAELEAWEATGLVTGKTWLLAPDPCEFCEAVSKSFENKSVGLRDTFYKKGDVLTGADGGRMVLDFEDVTAPPLHPNCRCSMIPKLVSELDEITREIEDSGALARAQAEVNAEDAKR
jgi:HK97 family phage portal protein